MTYRDERDARCTLSRLSSPPRERSLALLANRLQLLIWRSRGSQPITGRGMMRSARSTTWRSKTKWAVAGDDAFRAILIIDGLLGTITKVVNDNCTGNITTIDGTPSANLPRMFSPAWQDTGCHLTAGSGVALGSDMDLNTLSNLYDLKAMTRRSYFVIFSSRRTRG